MAVGGGLEASIIRILVTRNLSGSLPHTVYFSSPKTLLRGILWPFLYLPKLHSCSLLSLFLLFVFITLFYDETLLFIYHLSFQRAETFCCYSLLISQGLEQCCLNIGWINRAACRGTFYSFSAYKNVKKLMLILEVKWMIHMTLPLPFICFVTSLSCNSNWFLL